MSINKIDRLSTDILEMDKMLDGGIPKKFLVAVVGEPGCGKTIFCLHFINAGLKNNEKAIFVTTEESKESIIRQALQFNFNFSRYIEDKKLIVIDALLRPPTDSFSLKSLDIEELLSTIIKAKKTLGYGDARLVIDSLSAFWLDKPAMARRYSYIVKKVLYQWGFTTLVTSQYAITTSEAFGFGIEHIADGIIRFRKIIRGGVLKRYVIVEKMRQTAHDLRMYEILIENNTGIKIVRSTELRKEDFALPKKVTDEILRTKREKKKEIYEEL